MCFLIAYLITLTKDIFYSAECAQLVMPDRFIFLPTSCRGTARADLFLRINRRKKGSPSVGDG